MMATTVWGVGLAFAARAAEGTREARIVERFHQLDRNGDGVLSKDEWPKAPWTARVDRNGDGVVTLEEAKAAFDVGAASDNTGLIRKEWWIDGTVRQALVYVPAKATQSETPVVFAFHGHGGTMQNAARNFHYHTLWPEAISVYMQGLPTPGMTDPQGVKPGWQKTQGDQGDRDLKFFDEVLAGLKRNYKIDSKRIYATGHSNGGGFTYVLWAARGDIFAAVAPSAAGGAARNFAELKPLPALHIAGEQDEIVPFAWQARTMEAVRKLNHCDSNGKAWANAGSLVGTLYPSATGTPFIAVIHPGTHKFPDEAPSLVVRFFQEHVKT